MKYKLYFEFPPAESKKQLIDFIFECWETLDDQMCINTSETITNYFLQSFKPNVALPNIKLDLFIDFFALQKRATHSSSRRLCFLIEFLFVKVLLFNTYPPSAKTYSLLPKYLCGFLNPRPNSSHQTSS